VQIRPYWNRYFKLLDSLVFVVDSSSVERLDEAKHALWTFVLPAQEVQSSPLLIIANKHDKSQLSVDEV